MFEKYLLKNNKSINELIKEKVEIHNKYKASTSPFEKISLLIEESKINKEIQEKIKTRLSL